MMTYTVHEPPGAPADRIERAEALVFVRDGFSAFAAFLTPFWMLANRLWLALLGYLVAVMLLGALIGVLGVGQDIAGALMFAGHMIVGFEADAIRRWSLGRQGYSMIGSVNGRTTDDCERRFFETWLKDQPFLPPSARTGGTANREGRLGALALGLRRG